MKKIVIRSVGVLTCSIILFLLQNNINRLIPVLTVAPNFLLILTFSIGFLRGRMAGMMTGLFCGLLMDAFGGGILGYYTLIFIYVGYFNGLMSRILVNDILLLPLILCCINEICYAGYIYVFRILLIGKTNFGTYISTIAIPELVLTLFGTVILYGILMTVNERIDNLEKKKEFTLKNE